MSTPAKTPPTEKRDVTVTSVIETAAVTPDRLGKKNAIISYQVGPFERYQFTVPAEGLTEDKVKAAIIQDFNSRPKLRGIKFQI